MDEFNIDYLYHLTHKDNLNNILQNGLESHNVARERHMIKVDIADNVVNDRKKRKELIYNRSLHDYVPLYFNPKNPMLYKRKKLQDDIVILSIDKNILKQKNVFFTDRNIVFKSTKIFKNLNDLYELEWKYINNEYWTEYEDRKRFKYAEVLVFPKTLTSTIKKIFSNNEQTK